MRVQRKNYLAAGNRSQLATQDLLEQLLNGKTPHQKKKQLYWLETQEKELPK